MYSANGRVKSEKETSGAKVKFTKTKIVCSDCSFEDDNSTLVFGEKAKCIKCGSENCTICRS